MRTWRTLRDSLRTKFISAATWHGSLQVAAEMLASHPELASSDIHTAAILGDEAAVRRYLAEDPANATATCDPYGGNPLTHLCMSKYLRLDPSRSDAFIRAATALLDAGADPNGGFWTKPPNPEFETPLYGAAGIADHYALTKLLLERGADPNDEEACYHAPEDYRNGGVRALVETGRVNADNLSMMLVRKHDRHDVEGLKYLLDHGADPNHWGPRGWSPLHHSIKRDNWATHVEALLDHGADPTRVKDGVTAIALAARRGRNDLLQLFENRGFSIELTGMDGLLSACARHRDVEVREIASRNPELVGQVVEHGGQLLAIFAGTWNTEGCRLLLELGAGVNALHDGDAYYGTPRGSSALHVAAWRGVASSVKLLIDAGATVDAKDGSGSTPLMLAVKACVDSYWTERRTPEAVRSLLAAGASTAGVQYPCGYAEVDEQLKPFQ